jgi:hypothetical protein
MTLNGSSDIQKRKYKLILAIIFSVALFTLYFYFLGYFIGPLFAAPFDAIQSAIFYTMILRVLGIAFVPLLKKLHAQVKILVFSFEAFALCFLILGFVSTGNQSYSSLLADVLTSWLATTLIVLTPYSIYELAIMMYKGTSLTALFVSSTPVMAIAFFLADLVVHIPNPQNGLSNFGSQLINSLRAQPSVAEGSGLTSANSLIPTVSVVIFLVLAIYVVLDLNESVPTLNDLPKYHYALALAVIGSIAAYIWLILTTHDLNGNVFEILSAPTIIIPIVLWVITRRE